MDNIGKVQLKSISQALKFHSLFNDAFSTAHHVNIRSVEWMCIMK